MNTTITSDPFAGLQSGTNATSANANADAASADRFLKLLVTQLQNQDPLNPMDNAQITSQMAQINTVTGLQTLNTSVQGLNAQFVQSQALQGAALVGRQVTVQGNRLAVEGGRGSGAFELGQPADRVQVEILNAAGRVVDTIDLGAQNAGRHAINWAPASTEPGMDYRFRVSATSGALTLPTTPLMRDEVLAVSTSGSGLVLQTLFNGDLAYGDVKAFN